ncbi:hypothetical protein TRAPUB_424 [Trametes pubescens]|uniref:Uncharacterized protein n=1 Tax=Trametes pubescens TaxID=154538 RepID=A0A1M2VMA5_TRAPU|nr:hypothetical protein TRAPUB_424 [Trametes pubescens]
MPSSSNKLSSDPTSAAGVHGDIPNSGVLSTSPPRFEPTLYTHNEASGHTLASPHSTQSPAEPLVPNRLEHLPSLSPVSSTSFSTRESIASTVMPTSEEDAYITDGTTSTIPPSYKTHRSHPDLPGYSWTDDQPPLSLPITSTSPAEYVAAPPPAYVQSGRHRRRRHPRVGGSANGLSSNGESFKATEPVLDLQERPYEATRSREAEQQRNPRKSTDGGVRLAGGPLNEA